MGGLLRPPCQACRARASSPRRGPVDAAPGYRRASWAGRRAARAAAECINGPEGGSNPHIAPLMQFRAWRRQPRALPASAGPVPLYCRTCDTTPLGCLFEIVETLVLTLIIFFVIQTFVAQPYRVEQQSMERTLEPDEYVLVDKLTPAARRLFARRHRRLRAARRLGRGWPEDTVHQAGDRPRRRDDRDQGRRRLRGRDPARGALHLRSRSRRRPTTSRRSGWFPSTSSS